MIWYTLTEDTAESQKQKCWRKIDGLPQASTRKVCTFLRGKGESDQKRTSIVLVMSLFCQNMYKGDGGQLFECSTLWMTHSQMVSP